MAYKVVLSNRLSIKLARLFFYLENNYSKETADKLAEKIDSKMLLLSHQPEIGFPLSQMPGMRKISLTRVSKLYYRLRGRKIIILDLIKTGDTSKDSA